MQGAIDYFNSLTAQEADAAAHLAERSMCSYNATARSMCSYNATARAMWLLRSRGLPVGDAEILMGLPPESIDEIMRLQESEWIDPMKIGRLVLEARPCRYKPI